MPPIPFVTVEPGQRLVVRADTAVGATVLSGGTIVVGHGSETEFAQIHPGGTEIVNNTGTAIETLVVGTEDVAAGGTAIDEFIVEGALEVVYSGGLVESPRIGGTLDLKAGAEVSGQIGLIDGGTLEIEGKTMPLPLINGLFGGDVIDFRSIPDVPRFMGLSYQSGLLQITEGASTYQIGLAGSNGEGLELSPDGHSGTELRFLSGPEGGDLIAAGSRDIISLSPADTVTGGSNDLIYANLGDVIESGDQDTVNFSSLGLGSVGALLKDTGSPISDTVIGFVEGIDHLSFAGETPVLEARAVATAKTHDGNTILSYPDHSTITLVGVTHVDTGIFF